MKSQVRIIGGRWRGRKLAVVDAAGLRPTPDRIRETLFNWLGTFCHGASVLDCFAGSGVLGFEALSRGATSVVAMEQNPAALANLRQQAQKMDAAIEILGGDARRNLLRLSRQFDLVFIDPPYAEAGLRTEIFNALEAQQALRDGARIYFEWPRGEDFILPSEQLEWSKHKTAGQVEYAVAEWRVSR
jgi:16S rRNA (guanine966-N2)-methyltransferase